MSPPLVSIIIPCYRQAHFLAEAIDAALGQSYPAIEVVVVSDGPDDKIDEVAQRYKDKIIYVRQTNQGVSAARNAGIAVARGKYLHFLDADDMIHPDAIGWLVEAAGARDDVLCVMNFRAFFHDGSKPEEDYLLPENQQLLNHQLLTINLGPPLIFLCSREAVLACGGFERGVESGEDWDLWLRLVFAGLDIIPVNRVGAYYRQHAESATRNQVRMTQILVEVMSRTLRRVKKNPLRVRQLGINPTQLQQELTDLITCKYLEAGYLLRQQGEYLASLIHYWRSVRRGKPKVEAFIGTGKLLPHRIYRTFTTKLRHSQ